MNRNQAKELLPVIKAFSEGKDIETKTGSGWISIENMSFAGNPDSYRIKLEPRYRPFKDADECWDEMQIASVYACSAIFDEKTKVIEGRQKELEKAIVNLHDAIKELEN